MIIDNPYDNSYTENDCMLITIDKVPLHLNYIGFLTAQRITKLPPDYTYFGKTIPDAYLLDFSANSMGKSAKASQLLNPDYFPVIDFITGKGSQHHLKHSAGMYYHIDPRDRVVYRRITCAEIGLSRGAGLTVKRTTHISHLLHKSDFFNQPVLAGFIEKIIAQGLAKLTPSSPSE